MHIESQWSRRREWAIRYRTHILTRGNQTTEAGIRIVKELVFNRVKATTLSRCLILSQSA